MKFLVMEIALHLALAAVLGVVLGYAIWGLRRRDARPGPDGDEAGLRAELERVSAERDELAAELETLRTAHRTDQPARQAADRPERGPLRLRALVERGSGPEERP